MLDGMALALEEIAPQLAWSAHFSGREGFRMDATVQEKLADWCKERVGMLRTEADREREAA